MENSKKQRDQSIRFRVAGLLGDQRLFFIAWVAHSRSTAVMYEKQPKSHGI
jgi:hypothetical protein